MRTIRLLALMLLPLLAVAGTAMASPGGKLGGGQPSDANTDNSRNFVSQMTGAEETPPVATDAHGVAIFHFSSDGLSLDWKLMARDIISVTAGHIHTGTIGVAGPVVLPLVSSTACTVDGDHLNCEGTATAANLTGPLAGHPLSDLEALLEDGRGYSNVHTTAHPGGEIRGQLGRHGSPAAAEDLFKASLKVGGAHYASLALDLNTEHSCSTANLH